VLYIHIPASFKEALKMLQMLGVFFIAAVVQCAVVEYDLTYSRQIASPDGFAKSVIVVNGLFPGPTLTATRGDTFRVTVRNHLPMSEQLWVHWHGFSQFSTPWYDGHADSNCPINYGSTYVYEFAASAPGTYWYHPHNNPMYSGDFSLYFHAVLSHFCPN
jgi:FtsP/CotA-like multicopper oxidase with cupredoxin domain